MYSLIRHKKRKILNKTKKMRLKKQMKREKNKKKTRRQKINMTIRSKPRSRVYRNTSKKIKGGTSSVGHYVGSPNNNVYLGYGEYQ